MKLDPEQEKILWQKKSQGDLNAREKLIIAYRPLVFWIAKKFNAHNNLIQDIIQEGMLALIRAVDKFEYQRNYKFSTFFYYKINGQIINMLERSELKAPVPVPDDWIKIADEKNINNDDWIDLELSIEKLKGNEAEIVSALFYDGKNPEELANEKNLNISHIYRLRRNAINKIRELLGLA